MNIAYIGLYIIIQLK